MPRGHPSEFRRRVLDLVRVGGTVAQLAGDLQVPEFAANNGQRRFRPARTGPFGMHSGLVAFD